MNAASIKVVRAPKAVSQSSMIGAGKYSDVFSGAIGYVRKHFIKLATVKVELLNGIVLHNVIVPSREWVCDAPSNSSTGGMDLPPVGSLVFVMFPYGAENPSGAIVLFSVFDSGNTNQAEFLKEGDEKKAKVIREGGIKATYDREAKSYTIEDVDDAKLVIKLDKGNKKLSVSDWNDNKITSDSNGLKLESKGNTLSLESGKTLINGHLEVLQ